MENELRYQRMRRGRKGLMIAIFVIAVATLLSFIVMYLWNMILPGAITGVNPINFWQAAGLLLLSKILFGGMHGGWKHKRQQWKDKINSKLEGMTPEEREKFKAELRNRCRGPWNRTEGN
jgi:hypothetical protein